MAMTRHGRCVKRAAGRPACLCQSGRWCCVHALRCSSHDRPGHVKCTLDWSRVMLHLELLSLHSRTRVCIVLAVCWGMTRAALCQAQLLECGGAAVCAAPPQPSSGAFTCARDRSPRTTAPSPARQRSPPACTAPPVTRLAACPAVQVPTSLRGTLCAAELGQFPQVGAHQQAESGREGRRRSLGGALLQLVSATALHGRAGRRAENLLRLGVLLLLRGRVLLQAPLLRSARGRRASQQLRTVRAGLRAHQLNEVGLAGLVPKGARGDDFVVLLPGRHSLQPGRVSRGQPARAGWSGCCVPPTCAVPSS